MEADRDNTLSVFQGMTRGSKVSTPCYILDRLQSKERKPQCAVPTPRVQVREAARVNFEEYSQKGLDGEPVR